MNELYFTLYDKDLSDKVLATDVRFRGVTLETQLHGGFGRLTGSVVLSEYDRYKWYSDYLNARLLVRNSYNEVVWEGRIEDIEIFAGAGVVVDAFGYWRNFFDVPLKDEDTWDDDGPHYPEDIIQAIIERNCSQIRQEWVNMADTERDVAPYKVGNYRYPGDLLSDLLKGGDDEGNLVYFAIWEDRIPWLFVKEEEVDWYVRKRDFKQPLRLRRSLDRMANAVIAEYSVEGQAGDANDDGTGTGERGNNYITLTDTNKSWDEGQWNRGFDAAIVSGTGAGQVRDIKETRVAPTIVDSGQCVPFVVGTSTLQHSQPEKNIEDSTNTVAWGNGAFTWGGSGHGMLWVDVIDGPGAGQQREIESDYANFTHFAVSVTPDWDEDEEYPSYPDAGSRFIVYLPSTLVTKGKSWVSDAYNTGHIVQIVKGRGAGQRRRITDTKQILLKGIDGSGYWSFTYGVDGDGNPTVTATWVGDGQTVFNDVWDALTVEPDWDVQPDDTSYFEIWEEAKVVDSGTATGGSYNTLTDSSKDWGADEWNDDYEVVVVQGNCSGQVGRIIDTASSTLTIEPVWDDEVPDSTSEYEIRVIREEDEEGEVEANQIVVTTQWTTQPDSTSVYEVRQKEDGGTLNKTLTRTAGSSIRDLNLVRKRLLSLGTTTPADAERIVARTLRLLRKPQQNSSPFTISKVYNKNWAEYPLTAVRAGDVIEVVDLFSGQAETSGLDALRRFYIIRTSFSQDDGSLAITPDNVDVEIATLIASGMK